jgi:oligopeptide transport system permease protein
VVQRLGAAVLVALLVASVGFLALHAAPGGPFDRERALSPEVRRNVERAYRLDRPLAEQYLGYLGDLARGDLGWSLRRPERVSALLAEGLPVSLELGAWALAFAAVFGVGLGLGAAAAPGRGLDHAARLVALLGLAVPVFVVGPLLIATVALGWGVLPAARWDGAASRVLPAVTLGLAYLGVIARLTRASALDGVRSDHARTARAKGLAPAAVLWRHALRPAVAPVVAYLGPASAGLLTGSIAVETIFSLPGLGATLVHAAGDRDVPVLCGLLVFYALVVVAANLLADLALLALDPRTRA